MSPIYNFSAGPAVLPKEVLKKAASEMLDYQGCGMSVMEMSHRSAEFQSIIDNAEANLRTLLSIPDNYKILFMQGGASTQFSAIPLNLLKRGKADYIVSGSWSKKAYKEATKYGDISCIGSSEDKTFNYIPDIDTLDYNKDADYLYICQNETIYGTCYQRLPHVENVPLVADVSSCFLSEPCDITEYGVMYGGVQKNVGPAGLAIVIVREDLIREDINPLTPVMLNWKTIADAHSLYNTPACYTIYMCGLVFEWILAEGGLEEMKKRNVKKAQLLYDYLDESRLFTATAKKEVRSLMNVPFVTGNTDLDAEFVAEAKAHNIVNIKGHRTVGGMRASIYNAMPYEGVQALVDFMHSFEKNHS